MQSKKKSIKINGNPYDMIQKDEKLHLCLLSNIVTGVNLDRDLSLLLIALLDKGIL